MACFNNFDSFQSHIALRRTNFMYMYAWGQKHTDMERTKDALVDFWFALHALTSTTLWMLIWINERRHSIKILLLLLLLFIDIVVIYDFRSSQVNLSSIRSVDFIHFGFRFARTVFHEEQKKKHWKWTAI